jgi:hypothetical protein
MRAGVTERIYLKKRSDIESAIVFNETNPLQEP